ncbi:virulence RhuM family protein [Aliarcobacter cryaerophilus]|uniref:virulence RhuM family protein n=1 Tax=Aliarcobacter cryaerophilus TaxID=28198 RepID=UPI0021B25609|nr:virulence RhuM family protein [Aliarcobacter cryaerophilus]MCT7495923.1 virulence RhuM family protein [Aliarcobacter cryaerophilus]
MDKQNKATQFLLYKAENGKIKVDVLIEDETVWLTIEQMAELFGKGRSTINEHILNIYQDGELEKEESMRKIGNSDFSTKPTNFYNLDVIISVGYRVKSIQGTRFRQWATQHLKEFIIKGFTMDDERLKDPRQIFGKDYFDEQLERIRDVRSSERRLYQKITDIYAQCSADYDPNHETSKEFFSTVQNKLHWAIVGETAAEIIYNRVDSNKQNMGLTSWKNSPNGRIRKDDVVVAKNYLSPEELDFFNRIVTMYLDYAEMQAKNKKVMYMKDWVLKLDAFLQFNEKEVLEHKGKISHEVAVALALNEFEKYRVVQDRLFMSDFDRLLLEMEDKK